MFSFESADTPLPEEVLLDTSYVVEMLIVSQPLHAAAVNFLIRLADEGVRIRFSSMLELELAETAFQIALKENHPKDWKRFRHDGRARPRAGRLMTEVSEAWKTVLTYFEHTRVDVEDVMDDVPWLMSNYGLASYDARHAATARQPDAVGIVTTDAGFCSLPASGTTIFTDSSRLARCRELRAQRQR